MNFEWDAEKERKNLRKHGIRFSTAKLVFNDLNRLEYFDEVHSLHEDRFVIIGKVAGTLTVLVVVYTERTNSIRIISARPALKNEEEAYYANQRNFKSN